MLKLAVAALAVGTDAKDNSSQVTKPTVTMQMQYVINVGSKGHISFSCARTNIYCPLSCHSSVPR
jgi:uncharacterized protein (UPF0333 family)